MWSSFVFALGAITPIFALMVLGYLIKRAGLVDGGFVKNANKLVFRVFLPASLFLNVYRIPAIGGFDFTYIGYALAVIFLVFLSNSP